MNIVRDDDTSVIHSVYKHANGPILDELKSNSINDKFRATEIEEEVSESILYDDLFNIPEQESNTENQNFNNLLDSTLFKDDEDQSVKVATSLSNNQILPSFITFDSDKIAYSIKPLSRDHLGSYKIKVNLSDSAGAYSIYLFDINVGLITGNGTIIFGGN
jgi:hypothetical protein